ncbi:MAG: nucleotidyltransferase family protein [Proteobacteria bacterium]|nr:nucleotidyltransferase family protein [Pseudomonadota bacterium]
MGRGQPLTSIDDLLSRLRQEMPRLREEHSVRSLGVFGSFVRGEQTRGSDLDVLIEFERAPGLLGFLDLERELSALLGVPVDLVQKEALKPAIGRRILEEVRAV